MGMRCAVRGLMWTFQAGDSITWNGSKGLEEKGFR
jgi:hypothetical protein